jgi:hypothetical protein
MCTRASNGAMPTRMIRAELRSFKLRFHDVHVRVVLADFDGPGVDLHGDDAKLCFELAKPMIAWLLVREPSVTLRAMSVDLDSRRVLVSFEDAHAVATRGPRPMVLRIDPPDSSELIDRAAPLIARLLELAKATVAKRVTK